MASGEPYMESVLLDESGTAIKVVQSEGEDYVICDLGGDGFTHFPIGDFSEADLSLIRADLQKIRYRRCYRTYPGGRKEQVSTVEVVPAPAEAVR